MELPEPDRSTFVEVNRTRLRVWEWGNPDAPVVLCAHGAYDHGRMWDAVAPRLAALGFHVVAVDLRGHGDSGRLASGFIWMVTALDLAMLARHYGPPVGLVGHSFGAGQVMYVAGVWPELVRWVVNIDGLGPPADGFEYERPDLAENARNSLEWAERQMFESMRVYPSREDMVERRSQINRRLPREWVEHLVRHGTTPAEGGFVWKWDPLFRVGFPGEFDFDYIRAEHELVTAPLLVLTGAEPDTWSELPPEEVKERLTHLSTARHEVIADAGHYIHIEQPDAVVEAIERFVSEVGP